jgi:hypothetical protein
MGQFSTSNERTQKPKIVIIVNDEFHDKHSVAITRRLQTNNPKHPHLDTCQTLFLLSPPPSKQTILGDQFSYSNSNLLIRFILSLCM